jgi:hypothetical protein
MRNAKEVLTIIAQLILILSLCFVFAIGMITIVQEIYDHPNFEQHSTD